MKIFAFGHESRAGKDTAASFLIQHIRATRRKVSCIKKGFASKLKNIAFQMYAWAGMMDEDYYEQYPVQRDIILPKIGKTPVEIWIELGTTVGRAIYPLTWIEEAFHERCDYLIFKDLRFMNEFEAVEARGGKVIRIDKPGLILRDSIADKQLRGIEKIWHGVIVNDSDFKTLYNKVVEVCDKWI